MKTINTFSELKSKGVHAGETVIHNNELYTFNGFSAYTCDHNLNTALRKIPKTEGKNPFIDAKYRYQEEDIYILIEKQNKNGTYHYVPINKKGKRLTGGNIPSDCVNSNEIVLGGRKYKRIKEVE